MIGHQQPNSVQMLDQTDPVLPEPHLSHLHALHTPYGRRPSVDSIKSSYKECGRQGSNVRVTGYARSDEVCNTGILSIMRIHRRVAEGDARDRMP